MVGEGIQKLNRMSRELQRTKYIMQQIWLQRLCVNKLNSVMWCKSGYFSFLQKNKNNKQLLPLKFNSSTAAGFIKKIILLFVLIYSGNVQAQQLCTIKGTVKTANEVTNTDAVVAIKNSRFVAEPDKSGRFVIKNVPFGNYTIVALMAGMKTIEQTLVVDSTVISLSLIFETKQVKELDEVVVMQQQEKALGIVRLQSIQNFTVYEGKKNEVVLLKNISANTATNNARQVYGTVTGLNIWESDGGGLQLGIGGRGLSPNRTSNFNTRQNGYDISADALGYPESYYTPATEALDRIEVIRGAAGLQYGTQFGGMVNFIFKKGEKNTPLEYTGRQTYGSWNFINSFNSIGGTSKNKKVNYYAFYQRKQGDGWRPNSHYKVNSGYLQLQYAVSNKTTAAIEYTHLDYLAKQAGGLTDALFKQNARQSVRIRNWFKVNWDLMAVVITHKFSPSTQLNIRNFGLLASRKSLGNLERINVVDFNQKRTLIDGEFKNAGTEIRLQHRYKTRKQSNILLAGARLYIGRTTAQQGDGDSLSGPNFKYLNPQNVEGSDYRFPNYNYSLFAEHVFNITDKLSLTPGIRFENIKTYADGYYRQRVFDFAGNIIVDQRISESLNRKRSFVIAGIGVSYKAKPSFELYGNVSQNYRAINFTDLRIQNPNFIIDSNLTDEKGFTADAGLRGSIKNVFTYEVTVFYLFYNNRIGQVLKADQPPLFIDYRYRTNVAASRNIGIESFASINLARVFTSLKKTIDWTFFVNTTILDARYIKSKETSIQDKKVEMVPPFIVRSGTTFKMKQWKAGFQFNYIARHYSDATNAILTATAVEGEIPAYTVADMTASFQVNKWLGVEFSCNNLLNEKYFTRRAEAYPGPGIIPSDGRSFFITAEIKLGSNKK
jgi:Fe(3+) dicitrate transport protein